LIPFSLAQGIYFANSEFADVFETDFRRKRLNRRNYLFLLLERIRADVFDGHEIVR